ncbi:MAG: copper resistance protein CopC [Pelagimonas sp.]|jgi:methionine-rich copper-binding protein CopC|nr:copper resistance protein CopC [Pelagimonas sp.]
MKYLAACAVIASLATGAFAHSRVDSTTPENGAVMAQPPEEISLSFADGIRLTRVSVHYQDQSPVRLDLGAQTGFDRVFMLKLPGQGAGLYRVEWRGLGVDGHAMQGAFSFTVK